MPDQFLNERAVSCDADTDRPVRVCAVLTGGSTTETISLVQKALESLQPTEMTVIDILNFYWRNPGEISYPLKARYVKFGPAQCGLKDVIKSSSLNLILNGGMFAFRRMERRAREILRSQMPDVLLICRDRLYAEVALVRAAQSLNIPTVLLQEGPFCIIGHGASNNRILRLKYTLAPLAERLGLLPKIGDYGHAGHDRICAASQAYFDRWVTSGISPSVLRVTGIPRYDSLKAISEIVKADAANRPPRRPRVYFLVQPFAQHGKVDSSEARRLMNEAGTGFTKAFGEAEFELIIRCHPRGSQEDFRPLLENLSIPYDIQEARDPFSTVLSDIDVVVGFYSSAILESLPCGVRAVCLRIPPRAFAEPGEAAKQDVIAAMGVEFARDSVSFAKGLLRTFNRADSTLRLDRLHEETGLLDGTAAVNVAQVLAEMAQPLSHQSVVFSDVAEAPKKDTI